MPAWKGASARDSARGKGEGARAGAVLGRALILAALACPAGATLPGDDHREVRGMTISCQTWGREWGSAGLGPELDELAALGVNWIAIHPYASVDVDGSVRIWYPVDPAEPPRWLAHPLAEARRRGMAVLVKPHLAYWGSPFSWRGDIAFDDPAARERFYADYRAWIVRLARATAQADAFAVGTELDRLVGDEAEWRAIIGEVREATPALLTFASNWSSYAEVPFWDALDAVGVQAYFPLTDAADPDEAELRRGWRAALEPLRELSQRTGKPVVFTELGYNLSLDAARAPWEHAVAEGGERRRARALQARCLRTGLDVLATERDWLRGAFLWKWFVGEAPRENFLVDAPPLRAALRECWGPRASAAQPAAD